MEFPKPGPLLGYVIKALSPPAIAASAASLTQLLIDCVAGGASVGFMRGLKYEKAIHYWRTIASDAETDQRTVLAAFRAADQALVGTVQLIPAVFENQPHRADITKMLVSRAQRRNGIGRALLRAAEAAAVRDGKTLLTLDTANPDAERLYAALGWIRVGRIPDFALMPDGTPCPTTIFYKVLTGPGGA
ncbi:MAG: GNAT family N-acetyltransferase [Proteobacteria bacterium]|nr:GNAT family N-acetyltransferase [Pseudomonadota bacterium]